MSDGDDSIAMSIEDAFAQTLADMEDDFDPESINIDITPYRTNEEGDGRQCFSGN